MKENIFLLGGGVLQKRRFGHIYEDVEVSLNVQRLDRNGWHELPDSNIERGIKWPIATVPLHFYWNNNWPKIDFDQLESPGEEKIFHRFLQTNTFSIENVVWRLMWRIGLGGLTNEDILEYWEPDYFGKMALCQKRCIDLPKCRCYFKICLF